MLANLLSRFHTIQFRYQLLLLILLTAIIPPAIVVLFGPFSATRSLSQSAETVLTYEAQAEIDKIAAFLSGVNHDVLFMSKVAPIQGIVRARAHGGIDPTDGSSYDEWVGQLQSLFVDMIEEKPHYMQLRYLDEAGNELVRVEGERGQVQVVTSTQLQNKADARYFVETMKISSGSLYISPVELNREQGVIEEPHRPVIRYATPIVDAAGQHRGIVVANIFAADFIDSFAQAEVPYEGEELMLVDQSGYYLAHPDSEKQWGGALDKEETLAKDFSPEIAEQILSNGMGVIDAGSDILTYHTFVPNPEQSNSLTAIIRAPKSSVFATVNSFRLFAVLMIVASLGVVMPLTFLRGRQLVGTVENLTSGIATSSQEMAIAIAEQERIASQQASSVNETTTTMDELEASSQHAVEQAQAAVEAARQAFEASEEGVQAVGDSLDGMAALEHQVGAIAQKILHLKGQAKQIGRISQLVVDFATQTNLLALNSSVEAVRAGEHGKGFSIVANEIRKLADQSQRSADQINALVSDIQRAIQETVVVAETGTETVKTGVQSAQRTETAFSDVKNAVNRVVLSNQQVSLNLKQQVNAIQQVVNAMDVINRGAQETATGLIQTKVGTEQLNKAASVLQKTV